MAHCPPAVCPSCVWSGNYTYYEFRVCLNPDDYPSMQAYITRYVYLSLRTKARGRLRSHCLNHQLYEQLV